MSDDKQTVADETEDQSRGTGAEAEGAREEKDTLDEALAEYEESTETPGQQQGNTDSKDQPDEVREYVRRAQAREIAEDVQSAVKVAKGDLEVDDEVVEAVLNHRASKDQRFANAWAQRHENPKGWERALKAMTPEIEKKLGTKVDKAATEDREAVAAAVRGSTTRAPDTDDEIPDFTGKSDAEFYAWVAKQKKGA